MFRWARIKKCLERPWAAYTFAICAGVVLFLFLSHFGILLNAFRSFYHVVYPVLLGLVIAYVLDPLVKFFESKILVKMKNRTVARGLSIVITFSGIVLFITILLVAMIPQLISSIRMFAENLGSYASSLNKMLKDFQAFASQHNVDVSDFIASAEDIDRKSVV